MNNRCELPEQTASYSVCLNDDVIMEGVAAITNTNSCQYDPNKPVETIRKEPVYFDNQIVNNFEDYYKLLLNHKINMD
jgi:hypothetical protein|tara:strand:+ start:232 stop:465 length:234 start_codon:yes stop_codon:yes gene_type:complete